jgi:uncharacterized membrane protein YhaH (DUF805 family)
MFLSAFSFKGRIQRLEYAISIFVFFVSNNFLNKIIKNNLNALNYGDYDVPLMGSLIIIFAYFISWWFIFAQGAKREHDLGNSGWWQLLPFRFIWLIFLKGQVGSNEYGGVLNKN